MKRLVLMLLFEAVCLPSFAQNSEQYRTCYERAKTQLEMNTCASEEAARTEAELNDIYRKLLAQTTNQQEAVTKIKAAERAWINYRDAYIEAMYPAQDKQAEYGSMYLMQVGVLRTKLTQQQIVALRELLRQYGAEEK